MTVHIVAKIRSKYLPKRDQACSKWSSPM